MTDRTDGDVIFHYVEQIVDGLLTRCSRNELVCEISVEIKTKDGKRVVHMERDNE
jgi:hypothetical protein